MSALTLMLISKVGWERDLWWLKLCYDVTMYSVFCMMLHGMMCYCCCCWYRHWSVKNYFPLILFFTVLFIPPLFFLCSYASFFYRQFLFLLPLPLQLNPLLCCFSLRQWSSHFTNHLKSVVILPCFLCQNMWVSSQTKSFQCILNSVLFPPIFISSIHLATPLMHVDASPLFNFIIF